MQCYSILCIVYLFFFQIYYCLNVFLFCVIQLQTFWMFSKWGGVPVLEHIFIYIFSSKLSKLAKTFSFFFNSKLVWSNPPNSSTTRYFLEKLDIYTFVMYICAHYSQGKWGDFMWVIHIYYISKFLQLSLLLIFIFFSSKLLQSTSKMLCRK